MLILTVFWLLLVAALACGGWVAVQGWEMRPARRFVALCGGIAAWSFFNALQMIGTEAEPARWLGRLKLFFLCLIPVLLVFFFMGWLGASKSEPLARSRLHYLRAGTLAIVLGLAASFFYLLAVIVLGIGLVLIATALAKERLKNPRTFFQRLAVETVVYALCLAVFWLFAFRMGRWMALVGVNPQPGLWALLGAVLAIGLARPLGAWTTRWTDKTFFAEKYRYRQALKAAGVRIGRMRDLRKLLNLMVRVMVRSMKVTHTTILLRSREQDFFEVAASHGRLKRPAGGLGLDEQSPLVNWLAHTMAPVVREDLEIAIKRAKPEKDGTPVRWVSQALKEMERLQAAVCVPSFVEQHLQGILVLGERQSGKAYAPEDLEIFSALAARAAFAVENAQAYGELKDTRDQLIQAERLATIGKFASNMAHEIKNPLQAILTFFEYLPSRYDDPEFRHRFSEIARQEAQRINELVRALVTVSNPKPPVFQTIDLHEVAENVMELMAHDLQRKKIEVRREYGPERLIAEADRDQMKQVLLNLVMNAAEAMSEGIEANRVLEIKTAQLIGQVKISVRDTGCGIPENQQSVIFTPFFTTKEKGSGLGLAIVQNIIKAHRGQINLESKVGEGTVFSLILPVRQKQATSPEVVRKFVKPVQGSQSIKPKEARGNTSVSG